MENLEKAVRVALEKLPVPVPNEEHQKNAALASSFAVDLVSFLHWENAGADEDDEQEVEVVAVAWLPDEQFEFLAVIAAAGDGESDGNQRRVNRVESAKQADSIKLRELSVWMKAIIDRLEDDDDDDGGNNGAPALRPRPRRKRRGYGMG